MIYPTFYRYSARYRGPKANTEISNVLTSISHDIKVVSTEDEKQSEMITENIIFALNGAEVCNSTVNTSGIVNDVAFSYKPIDAMSLEISSIETKLENALKNL